MPGAFIDHMEWRLLNLLAGHPSLTAREATAKLRGCGPASYPFVHKTLKRLCGQRMLICQGRQYRLSPEFLVAHQKLVWKALVTHAEAANKMTYAVPHRLLQSLSPRHRQEVEARIKNAVDVEIAAVLDRWYRTAYDPDGKEWQAILDVLKPRNKSVLEIGCGTGRVTEKLVRVATHVTAIDVNQAFIAYAKQRIPHADFRILHARQVQKLRRTFDVILATWAGMHYVTGRRAALQALRRVLRPHGRLAIMEAYPQSEYVAILNALSVPKPSIEPRLQRLKAAMAKAFGQVTEHTFLTQYRFASIEEMKEYFRIELEYEEKMPWTAAARAWRRGRSAPQRRKSHAPQRTVRRPFTSLASPAPKTSCS